MSKIPVWNMQGEQVGEYDLPDDLLEFGKGTQAMHDAVVAHLANCRAGTASTLTKGEVAGTGSKPWKQKGTGRARSGYRRSPVWRGGGAVFGPKPRDYGKKINSKEARLAFRRALSEKVKAGQVLVLDELRLDEAKTRRMAQLLKNLRLDRGALFLTGSVDALAKRASRNIQRLEMSTARQANTYQVLRYPAVVVTREAMGELEDRLRKQEGRQA